MASVHGETLYQLRRESVASRIERGRILAHLGLAQVTEAEVDADLERDA